MSRESLIIVLADAILIVHVLFVLFVIFGLVAVYLGYFLNWKWVRNRLFRILHLSSIAIVIGQSWAGLICPLTIWEMGLRAEVGSATYSGSFIQHWLHSLLYYSAPEWAFSVVYTGFGILIVGGWILVPPKIKER